MSHAMESSQGIHKRIYLGCHSTGYVLPIGNNFHIQYKLRREGLDLLRLLLVSMGHHNVICAGQEHHFDVVHPDDLRVLDPFACCPKPRLKPGP